MRRDAILALMIGIVVVLSGCGTVNQGTAVEPPAAGGAYVAVEVPQSTMLSRAEMERVLTRFLARAEKDPVLQEFGRERQITTHYVLHDLDLEFYMSFEEGQVVADMGPPPSAAEVRLETTADVLDGMFTGRINAMRAALSGRLSFSGEAKLAMTIQKIQDDLCRLYSEARGETVRKST
jgi:putative sterol carrier protein